MYLGHICYNMSLQIKLIFNEFNNFGTSYSKTRN